MPNTGKPYRQQHLQGDIVVHKLTSKKLLVLSQLESYEDEDNMGQKYLVRDEDHRKMQVFHCEVTPFRDTSRTDQAAS